MFAHLIHTTEGHNKFWTVTVSGGLVTCAWGKRGSWTQTKTFDFRYMTDARIFAIKKMRSKLAKGYTRLA